MAGSIIKNIKRKRNRKYWFQPTHTVIVYPICRLRSLWNIVFLVMNMIKHYSINFHNTFTIRKNLNLRITMIVRRCNIGAPPFIFDSPFPDKVRSYSVTFLFQYRV